MAIMTNQNKLRSIAHTGVWTQRQALDMCRYIESVCPKFGCHVALTGGLLYKDGPRKDADILFYRIRQAPEIDTQGLFAALAEGGFVRIKGGGWIYKCEFYGKPVDAFFPEEQPWFDEDGKEITYGEQPDAALS